MKTKNEASASLNQKQQIWQLYRLIGGYEWVAAVAATRLIKTPLWRKEGRDREGGQVKANKDLPVLTFDWILDKVQPADRWRNKSNTKALSSKLPQGTDVAIYYYKHQSCIFLLFYQSKNFLASQCNLMYGAKNFKYCFPDFFFVIFESTFMCNETVVIQPGAWEVCTGFSYKARLLLKTLLWLSLVFSVSSECSVCKSRGYCCGAANLKTNRL